MKIDMNPIFHNTTQTSLHRGKAIYHSQIIKAFLTEEGYNAFVAGSENYEIKISKDKYGVNAECSCPFDFHGNCKHIIAVAFAIQNGEVEERSIQSYSRGISTLERSNDLDFMTDTFHSVSDAEKLEFLEEILENNQALRMQFMQYFEL